MPIFSRMFGNSKPSIQIFADAATTLAETLESVFREIGGRPSSSQLIRQETAAFALTYCTLITLASSKGAPLDVQRRCDEMNSAAVDAFVRRGWVTTRGELVQKLGERYIEYSGIIQYEIFQTEGKNEHGGPSFAFATVFANAYESSGARPILQLTMQLGVLTESLSRAAKDVRKACD